MKSPNKNGTSKKTVLHFTAAWVPGEGEKEDPNCSVSGVIQVTDGIPTGQAAHLIYNDREEDGKASWWPCVTVPSKKQINFGPGFGKDGISGTDLHQAKIAEGSTFSITSPDGSRAMYRIERVEDLAG